MRFRPLMWLTFVLIGGCHSLENQLVFQPTPTDPKEAWLLPGSLEDVELRTADNVKIQARWMPRTQARGVLLYCHGNAGNLEQRGMLMRQFSGALDRSVLIFDYPGYGRSEGKPTEAGCYASAEAAYDWLTRVKHIPPEQIVICGESLGGGVAVDLATKRPHLALVLIRTFTSIPDVASNQFSLASTSLMVNRFDSLKKIPACPAPIFLAHADKDRLMPMKQAEQLRAASKAPVHFYLLQGLDHNDPLPPYFFQELRDFLTQVARDGSPAHLKR